MKTLIIYSYCELGNSPILRIKNLNFFLKKALIECEDIFYCFVISGHTLSITIPNYKNIKIIKRNNTGYDFGNYFAGLNNVNIEEYTNFIFLNDSVRGPFINEWYPKSKRWINIFNDMFDNNIKLVGPTLNFHKGKPHINTECFALDKIGLKICLKKGIFKEINTLTPQSIIIEEYEIKLSEHILNHGYNIKCFLKAYKGVDFRKKRGNNYKNNPYLNANNNSGDPIHPNEFFGINIQLNEVVFFKTNRNVTNEILEKYTYWELNNIN
jgi:hypothetical protein